MGDAKITARSSFCVIPELEVEFEGSGRGSWLVGTLEKEFCILGEHLQPVLSLLFYPHVS